MSYVEGKDYLFLIWHDVNTKKQYIVGTLSKNGKFEFEYNNEIDEAMKKGFSLLVAFPERKKYESNVLFPAFATRLPDKKRIDIDEILKKYNLEEYDAYELLKRSGAKLPIDNLEFIDPIFSDEEEIKRKFFVAGSRHYMKCEGGTNCKREIDIKIGDDIELMPELNNPKDKNAVKMIYKGVLIGYIPRYYAESIKKIVEENKPYSCKVIETNFEKNCRNCIKVEFNAKN